MAVRELGERVRGGRRDQVQLGALDQRQMADRGPVGQRLAGIGAARGSGSNSLVSTGAPVIPSNEARPTNRSLAGVWITRTAWPA